MIADARAVKRIVIMHSRPASDSAACAFGLPRNILASAFLILGGCAPAAKAPPFELTFAQREEIYAFAEKEFVEAIFYKPLISQSDLPGTELHPLIVQECARQDGPQECGPHLGSVSVRKDGALDVDEVTPTVYTSESLLQLEDAEYKQVSYLWAYPVRGSDESTQWRGVRITFGLDGYPIAWEALTSGDPIKRIFVSSSLEHAAEDVFGDAVSHRRHAVEQDAEDIIVVRDVDDGPVPMGPYVYICREGLKVTTILCRCSPSQVSRFAETVQYELRPFEELESAGVALPEMPDSLKRGLRWPYPHKPTGSND